MGRKTAISTTTHIMPPSGYDIAGDDLQLAKRIVQSSKIPVAAVSGPDGRLISPGIPVLEALAEIVDHLIVEADGSKRLPIKAPAAHEPVLPPKNRLIIAVAGLSALGQPLFAACHRAELAADILGTSLDEPITPKMLAKLLLSKEGQMKDSPDISDIRFFLNQADVTDAESVACVMIKEQPQAQIVFGSLQKRWLKRYSGN